LKSVSIPYRDDKNASEKQVEIQDFTVSIPYRDDKNLANTVYKLALDFLFQSLIGTIKTGIITLNKKIKLIGFNPL